MTAVRPWRPSRYQEVPSVSPRGDQAGTALPSGAFRSNRSDAPNRLAILISEGPRFEYTLYAIDWLSGNQVAPLASLPRLISRTRPPRAETIPTPASSPK